MLSPRARVSATISAINTTVSARDIVTTNEREKPPSWVRGFHPRPIMRPCSRI